MAKRRVECCVNDIDCWMVSNGLKLNQDKTELVLIDTREKRSAHACPPCFRREFACASPNRNYTRYQNKLDSGREIQKSKLHTQKISLEFHEHKVY